ncbi:MAG: pseudouridine synthase [Bacillota bacterium]
MARERLDRILAHLGLGSRKEVKGLIKAGKITVDGRLANDPGEPIDPESCCLAVDGQCLTYRRHFHYLLNKPSGVITATTDRRERTVLDLLPAEWRRPNLFPVGRLDKDTEGLLLLTTDGQLAHRLLAPKHHVDKTYLVRVDGSLGEREQKAIEQGVELEDGYLTQPGRLEILRAETPGEGLITIHEGKYHQIKRMFAALGLKVIYLKRMSMGPLQLDPALAPGEVRPLTAAEEASLYAFIQT